MVVFCMGKYFLCVCDDLNILEDSPTASDLTEDQVFQSPDRGELGALG